MSGRVNMTMYLDVRSTAQELGGIGESTVRRMIAEGRIPVVRLGRRVLIERAALFRLAEQGKMIKHGDRK